MEMQVLGFAGAESYWHFTRPLSRQRPRGQRGPATLPPRGRPPAPPPEGTPSLGGTGARSPGPPGGYRGAPARGVDVKPSLRTGSGGSPRGLKRPQNPKIAKKGDFSRFSHFLPILAKKRVFSRIRDPVPRGVLHQPLAPGPRGSQNGVFWAPPGKTPKKAVFRDFWPKSLFLGILGLPGPQGPPDPPGTPRVPRGPGARGWCKTPLAGPAEPGPPVPGDLLEPQDPWTGSRDPSGASRSPSQGAGTPPRGSRSEGFTSTPRAGAPRFPGGAAPGLPEPQSGASGPAGGTPLLEG